MAKFNQAKFESEAMKLTEKQKNCPYCSPNLKDVVPIVDGVGDFLAVENNGNVAFGNDGSVSYYERMINFCPMCGRPLGREVEL